MEKLKTELRSLVKENLTKFMDSEVELILRIGNYILESGGKNLRPVLVLAFAKMLNSTSLDNLIPLAVGLEYIHTASLLHDDVVDKANKRRGKPSANKVFGNDTVVLTGDYMYANALYLFSKYGNIEMIKVVSDAVKKMAEGQLLELKKIADFDMKEEEYFKIIDGKTAVLFAACSFVGANYANADETQLKQAYEYGINIGRAFQIIDDLLDYTSSEEKLGKPVCNDLREGKVTYPLIAVRDLLKEEEKEFFKTLIKTIEPSKEDILKAKEIVLTYKGHEISFEKAKKYVRKAIENLDYFPKNIYNEELRKLAEYIIERNV